MSNIETALRSIEAELALAKQGHAFYEQRVSSMQKALEQISALNGRGAAASTPPQPVKGKRGRKSNAEKLAASALAQAATIAEKPAKAAKAAKPAKTAKGRRATAGGNELPFTGGDFWQDLISDQPQSASDVLAKAIAGFGFAPTTVQRQKLAGRLTFALNALVKAGKITDSGKGRERRFFKA